MKYLKEWRDFGLEKRVNDFVELNKFNMPELWDSSLSESENIENMISYFMEFPDQMETRNLNIKKASRPSNSLDYAPIFQNIGGVHSH